MIRCGRVFGGFSSGISLVGMMGVDTLDIDGAAAADEGKIDGDEDEDLLFFLEPPPTGTFLRDPPRVQYLLQVLQKYLG